MKIAKWGNSLAIRIPSDVARELQLEEGDEVQVHSMDAENVALITDRQRRRAALDRLRALAVPFPPGYKFHREEANSR